MTLVRVLVANDQPLMLVALRTILTRDPGLAVAGTATNYMQLLRRAERLRPDVVIVDPRLGRASAAAVVADVTRHAPDARVFLLAAEPNPVDIQWAIEARTYGYAATTGTLRALPRWVRRVAAGGGYVAPALRLLGTPTATRGAAALTQREVEVMTLLVHEKSSKEIAELLRISPSTVATHRTSIMRKLDIHTATGLLRYALRAGIARDLP